jgi:serine/threonine protein kinase
METLSIITELMSCGTLKQYIRKHQYDLQWGKKHRIFLDICEGMEFLHASVNPVTNEEKKEAFHQDLKSSNVLLYKLDNTIRAKIGDFGLACKSL